MVEERLGGRYMEVRRKDLDCVYPKPGIIVAVLRGIIKLRPR